MLHATYGTSIEDTINTGNFAISKIYTPGQARLSFNAGAIFDFNGHKRQTTVRSKT
jgi:hypothetical protein